MRAAHALHSDDWLLKHINRVLIACSMCLSGYFGWVLGEGVFPLNLVLAMLCASVAIGVSVMFERAGWYEAHGLRGSAVLTWCVGALFLVANTIFDYSSAAAVRDAVSVQATNANNRAGDVRDRIALTKKNIEDAKATVAWQATLQPAASYEAEISNLEGNRTIMDRSKNCFDQTRADTKAHCEKLSAARANLAMAQQKAAYETQVGKWETELSALETKSQQNETHANPAVAQVKALFSWLNGSLRLDDDQIAWGQYAIMALMTILVNAGLAFLGHELGTQRALYQQAVHNGDIDPPRSTAPARLTYHGHPSDPHPEINREPDPPTPLRPSSSTSSSQTVRETKETVILAPHVTVEGDLPGSREEEAELVKRAKAASDDVLRRLREMKALGSA